MNTKYKVVITIAFIASLSPMLLKWFGLSGVVGISGIIIANNPIAYICVTTFLVITWVNLKHYIFKLIISTLSLFGIIAVEIYYFFMWYIEPKSKHLSFAFSLKTASVGFYIGLSTSIAILIFYIIYSLAKLNKIELIQPKSISREPEINIKQKSLITIVYIFSLAPLILKWFGGSSYSSFRGINILQYNFPFAFIILFLVLTWESSKNIMLKSIISAFSLLCMIGVEILFFLAYKPRVLPGFYIAFLFSTAMLIFYIVYGLNIYKKLKVMPRE